MLRTANEINTAIVNNGIDKLDQNGQFSYTKRPANTIDKSDQSSNKTNTPWIQLLEVPRLGNRVANLKGKVLNVNPEKYKIAIYNYYEGWWNKPYKKNPLTPIASDCKWECDITTTEKDYNATKLAVFLVHNQYLPPILMGQNDLPQPIYEDAVANIEIDREPQIEFLYIPHYGSRIKDLKGRVSHIDSNQYRLAIYIYVNGWYIKPYKNSPLTPIHQDGTWNCDITTSKNDFMATKIVVFLISAHYNPPCIDGNKNIPESIYKNALKAIIKER